MKEGFTLKGFITGSILSIIIGAGNIYVWVLRGGSPMAHDFYAPWVIFLMFILVLVNFVLKKINIKLSFSAPDMILMSIMMFIACALPGRGDIVYLPASLVAPFYYATPENKWLQTIIPNLKSWMVPQDPQAAKYFFEGLPKGMPIPWKVWIKPLTYWFSFLLVCHFVMICIMVMLRKQWVENERLVFPLVYLPIEMAKQEQDSSLPPIFRNNLLWLGFAIPFIVGSIAGLHYYIPSVPFIQTQWFWLNFHRIGNLPFYAVCFATIGFMYLLPSKISFGLWFFSLIYFIQWWLFGVYGFDIGTARLDIYSTHEGNGALNLQGVGAVLLLVFSTLWMARHHLKNVFLKAIGKANYINDEDEILPYKFTFWGAVFGLIFMGIWLNATGIPVYIVIPFLIIAFALFVGITRLVAEAGIMISRFPVLPSTLMTTVVDVNVMGAAGITGLTYTWVWAGDVRTFVMTPAIHGMKMTEGWRNPHPLFWAMIISIVLGSISAIWMIIVLAYRKGGINMRDGWVFNWGQQYAYNFATYQILNPSGIFWKALIFVGIGAFVMLGLTFMHYNFLWWPFHPLAFPAVTIEFVRELIIPIFIGWLIKTFIIKFAGIKIYKKGIPFFLGLIMGQFVVSGVWLIIDLFAGGIGNRIFQRG